MAPYAGQKALQPYACKGLKVALSPDFPKRFARARRSSKGRISNAPPPIRVHARERDVPKPPSRHEAQGVEADCEARGKLKNDKARGRFAGHSIAPVEDEPRANSERCYGLPC